MTWPGAEYTPPSGKSSEVAPEIYRLQQLLNPGQPAIPSSFPSPPQIKLPPASLLYITNHGFRSIPPFASQAPGEHTESGKSCAWIRLSLGLRIQVTLLSALRGFSDLLILFHFQRIVRLLRPTTDNSTRDVKRL